MLGETTLIVCGQDLTVEPARGTVFYEDKPAANPDHPTMKPVALIARMLANSARRGARVLDPFGGSGSTLIACEALGLCGHMVELDERFVDVMVARWENLTGHKAKLCRKVPQYHSEKLYAKPRPLQGGACNWTEIVMGFPPNDEIPTDLQSHTECGPRAVWLTLRYFGLDRSPAEIKEACGFIPEVTDGAYNKVHGTYLVGVAVALKEFGLDVEWSGHDPEPDPEVPVNARLIARAEQLGFVPIGALMMSELVGRLDGTRVAIVSHSYSSDGGAGHMTPTAEVRDGRVIFTAERYNPTMAELEKARTNRDQAREVVLAWLPAHRSVTAQ